MSEVHRAIAKELHHLNSKTIFDTRLSSKNICQLFRDFGEDSDQQISDLLHRIFLQGSKREKQSIYVVLKWYIALHEIIQRAQHRAGIEKALEIINSILYSQPKQKYQKYLQEKLLKPYRQYLNKFSQIASFKEKGSASMTQFGQRRLIQFIFCSYNLIINECGTLAESVLQFSGYLKRYYPCLNVYVRLVGRDTFNCYRKIKSAYVQNEICQKQLSFMEIQSIVSKISIFRDVQSFMMRTEIDIDTDAESEELEEGECCLIERSSFLLINNMPILKRTLQ